MDIQTGGLLLSAISALSSALQAYKAYAKVGESISKEEFEAKLMRPDVPEESAIAIQDIIDEKLLKKSLKKVMDNIDKLRDSIDGTGPRDRLRIADEVDRDICFELKFIKKYNNNVLPNINNPNLYDLWIQHSC